MREAAKNDADIVSAAARRIDEIFNPDGDFDEEDRARRRGLTLGGQGPDGMSRLVGFIDPETRATGGRHRRGAPGPTPPRRQPRRDPR